MKMSNSENQSSAAPPCSSVLNGGQQFERAMSVPPSPPLKVTHLTNHELRPDTNATSTSLAVQFTRAVHDLALGDAARDAGHENETGSDFLYSGAGLVRPSARGLEAIGESDRAAMAQHDCLGAYGLREARLHVSPRR